MRSIKIIIILLLSIGISGSLFAQRSRKKKQTNSHQSVSKKKKAAVKSSVKNNAGGTNVSAVPQTEELSTFSEQRPVADVKKNAVDTIDSREVLITSSFKPSLKYAAKINFTAATPFLDTVLIPLTYQVPASNLFFSYEPVSIRPLGMPADTGFIWKNRHRIKLGAGNLNSFFAEAKFVLGDGKNSITTLKGDMLMLKGTRFAQEFFKAGIDAQSVIRTKKNLEWSPQLFYNTVSQYRYGFSPASLNFDKSILQLNYHTLGMQAGLKNALKNKVGINYQPRLNYYFFSDNAGGAEHQVILNAPAEKSFGKYISTQIGASADISGNRFNNNSFNNQLLHLHAAMIFQSPAFKIHAGARPSWDNMVYSLQPDLQFELRLPNKMISVEAGWSGYFNKHSFRSLANFNPFISPLGTLKNTRVNEQFAGLKGYVGNHFTYNGRISLLHLYNQPLFINEGIDGKSFQVKFEPEMESVKIHGEIVYTVQESFSLLGAVNASQFNVLSSSAKAWGLVPFELTGTALWKPFNKLQLKSDFFYRQGSLFSHVNAGGVSDRLPPSIDLNLGAEYRLTSSLNAWLQMNNLFNNTYQRWNQYPVFGFNVMGGVVYSFK